MPVIRAVVFDVYKTLLDIQTDEESLDSYLSLSRWLSNHGVEINALDLRLKYLELCSKEISGSVDSYPDFDDPAGVQAAELRCGIQVPGVGTTIPESYDQIHLDVSGCS